MKHLSCNALVFALLALAGCASGSAGGPGVTDRTDARFGVGQPDHTFKLARGQASIRQGETRSVAISIHRAENFDQDVTLLIGALPRGLSVDIAAPRVGHGETEARFTLTAAADASLGDFSIAVTGHPTAGWDATNELDITVTKD